MTSWQKRLAQAERHVIEAEQRAARQHALVVRLERDNRLETAAKARETLRELEAALEFMRQHLQTERRKAERS
jgi:hypothetical protein